jgi:hypothetical protein
MLNVCRLRRIDQSKMRIAIFCLLGPPLGAIWLFGSAVLLGTSMGVPAVLTGLLFSVLFSYLPGFAPAILSCQVDDYLSDKLATWPRAAVTGLAGGAITVVWFALISIPTTGGLPAGSGLALVAGLALVGAVPAAVCSWLASRWAGDARAGAQSASPITPS